MNIDQRNDGSSQYQNGLSHEQTQLSEQEMAPIQKPSETTYSKADLEQILAEALRIALEIIGAKKQYTPQQASGGNSYGGYAQRSSYPARPTGPSVSYQSQYAGPRGPASYYGAR